MNPLSVWWAVGIAGLFCLLAVVVWFGSKRYANWSLRRRRWTCGAFAVGGVLAGVYVYWVDSQQRGQTLHEVVFAETELAGVETSFTVESPGVEHELLVAPLATAAKPAGAPLTLQIVLRTGSRIALDEKREFPLRTRTVRPRGMPAGSFQVWDHVTLQFTPQSGGRYVLTLDAKAGPLPEIHVRIADPTKTDGRRAPGY